MSGDVAALFPGESPFSLQKLPWKQELGMKENHGSIWDTWSGSQQVWKDISSCLILQAVSWSKYVAWCFLTSVCSLVRDQAKMLSEKYLHMGAEPKSQRVISKYYIFEELWYVWPCNSICLKHFLMLRSVLKAENYFKDSKFSMGKVLCPCHVLFISWGLMGQELLSGQLAKTACLSAALLAVIL